MNKTVLSFYVDDTNPYVAPPAAFQTFLDFVASEGAAGESSAIPGFEWEQHEYLSRPSSAGLEAYFAQVRRAYDCGVDTHFELFTHGGRFDFERTLIPPGAIHEGLWLYEPAETVEVYERYFGEILSEADRMGFQYSGMTWPGCGCEACARRYAELHAAGVHDPNPAMWQALLNLARAGRFRGRSVPCFFGGELEVAKASLKAGQEGFGVFDLPPNAADRCGLWLNDPAYVKADYYISADGRSGRIVDLVRARAPYCLFYCHWQGLNPANGVGWEAFTQVVRRVRRHLGAEIEWMRPSAYTDRLLAG
jgi:hypothetical protein